MRIIGVDPGLVVTGVGVIQAGDRHPNDEFTYIHSQIIRPPGSDLSQRLLHLHEDLMTIIREMECEVMAVEDQFFGTNVQTAFKTGQARGAALLAAARSSIPARLYPPARIKQAVVGNGMASKEQVRHLVEQILKVASLPRALDCSDALAVALCHAFTFGQNAASGEMPFGHPR